MKIPEVPSGEFLSLLKNGYPIPWICLPLKAQKFVASGVKLKLQSGRVLAPNSDVYVYQILPNN